MTTPIRVLSLIPTFWPRQGGAQMVLTAIAQSLGTRIENTVLTRGYADCPTHERYPDFTVERYRNPAPEWWKDYAAGKRHVPFPAKACVGVLDVLGALPPLRRAARQADLIHVHFPLPLGLSAMALSRKRRPPLVVTTHGNGDIYELPRKLAPLTRAVLRSADAVVSVSEDLATHLAREFGVDGATVVPNGVDTNLYAPAPRAASETITLLSVSRIVPRKNIDVLITAVQALASEGEPIELIIAGTGPAKDDVARMAAKSPATRFLGFVDEERKRELLQQADAFVQLSIREGLSIATLEALATGVPCVVSDLPGVREPITPGETGYLVPDPESVASVTDVLRRLLAERDSLPEMRLAARHAAETRFSHQVMADAYYRIYCQVLNRGTP